MSQLFKKHAFRAPAVGAPRQVLTSTSSDVLRLWRQPDCLVSIWEREWAPDLVGRLDALSFDQLPHARFKTSAVEAKGKLETMLCNSTLRDDVVIDALVADMESLIAQFSVVTGSAQIEARIEAVCSNGCRLFHIDNTDARLTTTYIGPGTVWVGDEHAKNAVLLQDAYAGPLSRLPRFAVSLFRGSASNGIGLVHRSPRIADRGNFRLLFCLTSTQER